MEKKITQETDSKKLKLIQDDFRYSEKDNDAKVKSIRYAICEGILSSFFYALNCIVIKVTKLLTPAVFTPYNFSLWRALSSSFVIYYLIKYTKVKNPKLSEINSKFWFIARTIGFYFSLILFIFTLYYLRVSTASCLNSIYPVIAIVLSAIVLHERIYLRYISGIALCFFGSALIVANERQSSQTDITNKNNYSNLTIGLILAVIQLILSGFVTVGQKMMVNEKLPHEIQMYYLNLAMLFCTLIACTITQNFGVNPILIGMSVLNGLIFYYANNFANEAMKVIDVANYVPISYTTTIFIFILGLFILGEKVYMTDLIGILVIVSFHAYNVWNPIKSE